MKGGVRHPAPTLRRGRCLTPIRTIEPEITLAATVIIVECEVHHPLGPRSRSAGALTAPYAAELIDDRGHHRLLNVRRVGDGEAKDLRTSSKLDRFVSEGGHAKLPRVPLDDDLVFANIAGEVP